MKKTSMFSSHDEFSNQCEEEEDTEKEEECFSEKQSIASSKDYSQKTISTSLNQRSFSTDSLVYVVPSDESCCYGDIPSMPITSSVNNDHGTKTSGSRWRDDETGSLVQIWRDKIYQTRWWKQSRGVRVNKEMWEEISQLLTEREVYRTPSQCQIRMKNLLQFYRQTTENRKSEKTRFVLPDYFDIVDKIMTRKEIPNYDKSFNHLKYAGPQEHKAANNSTLPPNHLKTSREVRSFSSPPLFEEERIFRKRKSSERSLQSFNGMFKVKPRAFVETTTTASLSPIMTTSALSNDQHLLKPNYHRNNEKFMNSFSEDNNKLSTLQNGHIKLEKNLSRNFWNGHSSTKFRSNTEKYLNSKCDHAHHQEQKHYLQEYHLHSNSDSALPSHLRNGETDHDSISYISNEDIVRENDYGNLNNISHKDILQLHYKQIEALLDIEKRRLNIEKERLEEEKEANNRTGAFLLEAVKILAETFRNNNTSNTVCSK